MHWRAYSIGAVLGEATFRVFIVAACGRYLGLW